MTRGWLPCPVVIALFAGACAAAAQTSGTAPRSFGALRDRVAQVEGSGAQEIRIHWFVKDPRVAAQAVADSLTVVDRQPVLGAVARERRPELAPDKLVVVLLDAGDREVDWRIIPDPRVIRGEFADADGKMNGQQLRRVETDFLVAIPDLPSITRLALYQPRWTGREFMLDLIGTVDLQ